MKKPHITFKHGRWVTFSAGEPDIIRAAIQFCTDTNIRNSIRKGFPMPARLPYTDKLFMEMEQNRWERLARLAAIGGLATPY